MRISHHNVVMAATAILGASFWGLPSVSRAQEKAGTSLWRAIVSGRDAKMEECARQAEVPPMPQNSLANPSSGITPTGKRLQPFGDPNYWGNEPQAPSPDSIAELPPIPDLRTPDQVSKVDQKRMQRNAVYAIRQAETIAKEEVRRAEEAAALMPPPDPSTALLQVQSQADNAPDASQKDLPDASNGGKLKPFGPGSTFVDNGMVKFRGGQQVPASLLVEEDDGLKVELPPLPDLRTPDQVSKVDQKRTFRINQYETRRIRNAAEAAAIDSSSDPGAYSSAMDPSTALVQVESKVPDAVDCGNRDRPNTINGSKLKPFNSESAYVKGNQLMFQHNNTQFVETEVTGMTADELAFELPPLPDLRTPDQVSKVERMRNLRNLKYRARQASYENMQRSLHGNMEPMLAPLQP